MNIALWKNPSYSIAEAPQEIVAFLTRPRTSTIEYVSDTEVPSFASLNASEKERIRNYVKTVTDDECQKLEDLAEYGLPEWDNTTFQAACNIFEMAKAPWSDLTASKAEEMIREYAPPFDDEGWSEPRLNRIINSAYRRAFDSEEVRPFPARPITYKGSQHSIKGKTAKDKSEDLETPTEELKPYKLIPASQIEIQKVEWLWDQRVALGEMSLLAGREGIGKSLISIWIAAQLSLGTLTGEFFGQPKNVLYLATEDSWNKTIAPRLKVSGADMNRVFREHLETTDETLYLPKDTNRLALTIAEYDIALIVTDPLMSFVGSRINSNQGREVRSALEPLIRVCHDNNAALLSLIHFNKTSTDDILNKITDSKAFTQLARTVNVVERDDEDEERNKGVIDTVKNNLGRLDLPAISYQINSVEVMTNKGPSTAPSLQILGDINTKVEDLIREQTSDLYRGQTKDCAEWLSEYIEENNGAVWVKDAKRAGERQDYKYQTLQRALKRLTQYKSQRMGGSDKGFAWFRASMSREDALAILESRDSSRTLSQERRDRERLRTELDF